MNISEKIALECGAKSSVPHVDDFFMPLINHDYIIIDGRSKYEFGDYDYFNDVVDLIRPELKKRGIDILYFCTDKMQKINCDRCFINISKKQEAFLIKKAKLVVACENYSLYFAAAFGTKSVGLYSVFRPENTRPLWNKASQVVLESHREGNLPSYGQLSESPKSINFISSFLVAQKILDCLGVPNNLDKYELLHIGENFKQKIVEIVPDFVTDASFLAGNSINLRLDYVNALSGQVFCSWLNGRKANIITDKDVNAAVLKNYAANILSITVVAADTISERFLKECKNLGLNVKIFCNDPDRINEFRYKFLDWTVLKDFNDKKLINFKGVYEGTKFVSCKTLISKGKQYSCKASFLAGKQLDKVPETVIFSDDFDKELEFFKVFNEKHEYYGI